MDDDRYIRITVEPMDALPDVLTKVRTHGGRPVFLTIPAASPLFLTASEFRALRETVRSNGANLVVISDDKQRHDFSRLFNLVPADDEAGALAWLGEQANPRPPARTPVDPALGPPKPRASNTWTPRTDPAPVQVAPAPSVVIDSTATSVPEPATSALVPVVEPLPVPAAQRRRRVWPWLLSLLVVLVLLAGAAAWLPQATVTLHRERTPVSTEVLVAVTEPGVAVTNSGASVSIPGQRQTASVNVTTTLPATGANTVPDQHASGGIVFANASTAPIALEAGAEIASDGGILFTLDADVTVPAATGNLSGNADGAVTAVEGGASGNLAQGALSGRHESGLFFSNRNGALTGGTDRTITVVSEEDLDQATTQLEALIPSALAAALSESSGQPVAIAPGSLEYEALDGTSDTEIGTEANEFTYSATTTATGLAFDPEAAKAPVLDAATAQVTVPAGTELSQADAEITYVDAEATDPGVVLAQVLLWQLADIDDAVIDGLPDDLARTTIDEAMAIASPIAGVESVSISVKPDWLPEIVRERMPLVPQRIEVLEE